MLSAEISYIFAYNCELVMVFFLEMDSMEPGCWYYTMKFVIVKILSSNLHSLASLAPTTTKQLVQVHYRNLVEDYLISSVSFRL